ncbi:hypothetical protein LX86_007927 [Lentzea aerocolonigenes]|nr:hypothetical protein [Lentzea aerocolonigenes]
MAAASVQQFEVCQAHAAEWVSLSPPALLKSGERTGSYPRSSLRTVSPSSSISPVGTNP